MSECKIVQDLLPLYDDGLVSEETADFIRAHAEGCAACREKLARQNDPVDEALKIEGGSFRSSLRRHRNLILVVIVAALLCGALFCWAYFSGRDVLICEITSPDGNVPVMVIRKANEDYWVYYSNGGYGGGYLLKGSEEFVGLWFAPSSRYYLAVTTDEAGTEQYYLMDLHENLKGVLDPETACGRNEKFAAPVREKYGIWTDIRFRYLGWDSTEDSILFAYTCTGRENEVYTGYFWYDVAAQCEEGLARVTEVFP